MNILLITDDNAIVSQLKHSFKKGFSRERLFIARSGSEAIEILNKGLNSQLDLVPGLIVVDFDSPQVNALYVLQRLTSDLRIPDAQIALVTSPLAEQDVAFIDSLELDAIVEKPLKPNAFEQLLQSLSGVEQGAGATYRLAADVSIDAKSSRKVLIFEPSTSERKRLNEGLKKRAGPIITVFVGTTIEAKRKLGRDAYVAMVVSANGANQFEIMDLIADCRQRSCPIFALVEQGDEDVGRALTLAGVELFLVRDSGNYLNILYQLVGNAADIKRLELLSKSSLDADKEMLRGVIERAPLMVLRIDKEFNIQDCNDAFAAATKKLHHALIGRHLFDILPDLEVVPMVSVLEDGIPYSRNGFRMKTIGQKHSAKTYWDFNVWSIRRSLSSGYEAILIAADVSERVELEQQRERFLVALAHDIRNPVLGGQRVLDSVLTGKYDAQKSIQLLKTLSKSNQSLILMLSNHIDLYKFETASMSFAFRAVDLAKLLNEQVQEVAHIAAASDIVIIEEYVKNLPKVSGDINSLRRLLSNLFHNALKYAMPKSEIEVKAWFYEDRVSFRIRNKGNPIATEKMSELFRSVSSDTPVKHGSGVGLYLCRRIVEAHEASIDCTSSSDSGTTFVVRMNAYNSSDESQSA